MKDLNYNHGMDKIIWTAADFRRLSDIGMDRKTLALRFEMSVSAIRRVLARPDCFRVDVPRTCDTVMLAAAIGKRVDTVDWTRLEYRDHYKTGTHRPGRIEVATPLN